eukprot:jgi/Antlo1/1978/150
MDVKSALQYLYELPKFDVQKEFCRSLAQNYNLHDVFCGVLERWGSIPTNRKDKFFYLVSLVLPRIDYDILSIEDTELRNYCLRVKFVLDENMVRYASICRHRSTLQIIKENVSGTSKELGTLALDLGKRKETKQPNREVLYHIYSASKSTEQIQQS